MFRENGICFGNEKHQNTALNEQIAVLDVILHRFILIVEFILCSFTYFPHFYLFATEYKNIVFKLQIDNPQILPNFGNIFFSLYFLCVHAYVC